MNYEALAARGTRLSQAAVYDQQLVMEWHQHIFEAITNNRLLHHEVTILAQLALQLTPVGRW